MPYLAIIAINAELRTSVISVFLKEVAYEKFYFQVLIEQESHNYIII